MIRSTPNPLSTRSRGSESQRDQPKNRGPKFRFFFGRNAAPAVGEPMNEAELEPGDRAGFPHQLGVADLAAAAGAGRHRIGRSDDWPLENHARVREKEGWRIRGRSLVARTVDRRGKDWEILAARGRFWSFVFLLLRGVADGLTCWILSLFPRYFRLGRPSPDPAPLLLCNYSPIRTPQQFL
jgi:hypothetical protein